MNMKTLLVSTVLSLTAVYASFAADPVVVNVEDGVATTNSKYKFVIPDQKLVLPANIDPGETVFANLSDATNNPQYLVASTYHWKVYQDLQEKTMNLKEWPDGSCVAFGSGITVGRTFTVICSCNYLYLVKDDKGNVVGVGQRSKLLSGQTVVGNVPPGPGPGPGPNPKPPVFPDGKYKLSATTYDAALATVPANTNRPKAAAALSKAFNGVAAAVAAGTVKDLKDLLAQSKAANQKALADAGVPTSEWDAFFTKIQGVLYPLYSDNKMVTPDDFATAFKEIAVGLDAVK